MCSLNNTVGKMTQTTNRLRENTFQIKNFIKDLYPEFIRCCHNSTNRKISNPIKTTGKGFKQKHFIKEDIQMENKHIQLYSISLTTKNI